MPPPAGGPTVAVDVFGLRAAIGRLSGRAQRSATVAATVAAAVLGVDERVVVAVQGRLRGRDGVALLTDRRVLLVNDEPLEPVVRSMPLRASMVVQGWQDDRVAALVVTDRDVTETIDRIVDRPLAVELARRLRSAVGF